MSEALKINAGEFPFYLRQRSTRQGHSHNDSEKKWIIHKIITFIASAES